VTTRDLAAVLAPGYGGDSQQPIVQAMARRLEAHGVAAHPISYARKKPGGDLKPELDEVRDARDELLAQGVKHVALVGRSFGGRVCTRLAAVEPPTALIVLAHPIAPRGRPRPEDEAALAAVSCPTLIVQGDRDALGPLDVLQRIAAQNSSIELYVLKGAGHNFGPRQAEGLEYAASWLVRVASGT
jgi:predicted alpha/beta-hydrolase family hydrolase